MIFVRIHLSIFSLVLLKTINFINKLLYEYIAKNECTNEMYDRKKNIPRIVHVIYILNDLIFVQNNNNKMTLTLRIKLKVEINTIIHVDFNYI